jgi:hypothetical protein
MLRNLQRLPVWQRSVIFFSILIGVILGLIGLTLLLIGESFAAAPRQQGQALVPDVSSPRCPITTPIRPRWPSARTARSTPAASPPGRCGASSRTAQLALNSPARARRSARSWAWPWPRTAR